MCRSCEKGDACCTGMEVRNIGCGKVVDLSLSRCNCRCSVRCFAIGFAEKSKIDVCVSATTTEITGNTEIHPVKAVASRTALKVNQRWCDGVSEAFAVRLQSARRVTACWDIAPVGEPMSDFLRTIVLNQRLFQHANLPPNLLVINISEALHDQRSLNACSLRVTSRSVRLMDAAQAAALI